MTTISVIKKYQPDLSRSAQALLLLLEGHLKGAESISPEEPEKVEADELRTHPKGEPCRK